VHAQSWVVALAMFHFDRFRRHADRARSAHVKPTPIALVSGHVKPAPIALDQRTGSRRRSRSFQGT